MEPSGGMEVQAVRVERGVRRPRLLGARVRVAREAAAEMVDRAVVPEEVVVVLRSASRATSLPMLNTTFSTRSCSPQGHPEVPEGREDPLPQVVLPVERQESMARRG